MKSGYVYQPMEIKALLRTVDLGGVLSDNSKKWVLALVILQSAGVWCDGINARGLSYRMRQAGLLWNKECSSWEYTSREKLLSLWTDSGWTITEERGIFLVPAVGLSFWTPDRLIVSFEQEKK